MTETHEFKGLSYLSIRYEHATEKYHAYLMDNFDPGRVVRTVFTADTLKSAIQQAQKTGPYDLGYEFDNINEALPDATQLDFEVSRCLLAEQGAIPERSEMTWAHGAAENLIILMYELGAVCKDYVYSARGHDDETVRARASNAIVELSDVVTQALIAFSKIKQLTTSLNHLSIAEFIRDGLNRQRERMDEITRKAINYKEG